MGNDIKLTRGDSLHLHISLQCGQEEYELKKQDKLVFTVKKSTRTSEVLIQKDVSDGMVDILPSDTRELSYGDYTYDVQLTLAGGDVYTVIKPSLFKVTDEVNFD